MSAATYSFANYLAQVPTFRRKDDVTLRGRATTAANLIFDPQKSEQERRARWDEAQHVNNMQKLKASGAGVDESLAYNNAQRKKANAIRAVGAGAIGSSGLGDYLGAQTDAATEAQRLNIAATLAANNAAEVNNYGTLDRQNQDRLGEIERLRGETNSSLLDQYLSTEDDRENNWNQNALQVALGIGSGEMQAADLNQRTANEAARIAEQRYATDMSYRIAQLPYQQMTKSDKARYYLDSAGLFGMAPGKVAKPAAQSTNFNSGGQVGLRSFAEGRGANVGYDQKTGIVSIGSKTYTPATLTAMGGYIGPDNRWKLPESQMEMLMRS